jgi:hypothetical protein
MLSRVAIDWNTICRVTLWRPLRGRGRVSVMAIEDALTCKLIDVCRIRGVGACNPPSEQPTRPKPFLRRLDSAAVLGALKCTRWQSIGSA